MGIFKKKIQFVAAICPECQGHLELDANLETAFCQYCGAQCIVENAKKKKEKKQGKFEMLLGFIERQQDLRRKDRVEKQKKKEAEEQERKREMKKYWWIYAAIMGVLLTFSIVMAIIG